MIFRIWLILLSFSTANEITACENFIPALSSLVIAMHTFPSSEAYPFGLLFSTRKGREGIGVGKPKLKPSHVPARTPIYYKMATELLDWVFKELDASEEDPEAAQYEIDQMTSSSEEDFSDFTVKPKPKKKSKPVRDGRIDTTTNLLKPKPEPKRKKNIRKPFKFKAVAVDYEESIEKASLTELKQMLNEMNHKNDEGFLGSKIFKNPVTSSIMSIGTRIFRTMYCGWTSSNSYCGPPNIHQPPRPIFDEVFYRKQKNNP